MTPDKSLPEAFALLARAALPETEEFLRALRRRRQKTLVDLMGASVDNLVRVQGCAQEDHYLIQLFEEVLAKR